MGKRLWSEKGNKSTVLIGVGDSFPDFQDKTQKILESARQTKRRKGGPNKKNSKDT